MLASIVYVIVHRVRYNSKSNFWILLDLKELALSTAVIFVLGKVKCPNKRIYVQFHDYGSQIFVFKMIILFMKVKFIWKVLSYQ